MHSFRAYVLTSVALLLVVGLGCQRDGAKGVSSAWQDEGAQDGPKIEDAPRPRITAETHLASARMLERQNNLEGAIEQYEQVMEINPNLIEAYNRLGMIHLRLKQFEEAERVFKRGMDIQPESAAVRNNLGYCYLKQERYKKAEEEFRLALAIAPEYKRARMNLAVALARTNRLGASAIEFNKVVPKEAAYFNVAVICTDMKNYEYAEQALVKALDANPNYGPAKSQMAKVLHLRKGGANSAPVARSGPVRKGKPSQRSGRVLMTPVAGRSSSDRDLDVVHSP